MSREAQKLIFGGSSIGGLYQALPFVDAVGCVRRALAGGVLDFDTAPHYGCGSAEKVLGAALGALGSKHVARITTKLGRVMEVPSAAAGLRVEESNVPTGSQCVFPGADRDVVPVLDYSAGGFEKSYRQSLERLGVDRVHGLRVHDCDDDGRLQQLESGGGIEWLTALRQSGDVAEIGIGCNDVACTLRVMALMPVLDVVLIANRFNLLDHPDSVLALFAECRRRNVEVQLAGVFASGILADPEAPYFYSRCVPESVKLRVAQWGTLARKHAVELPAVALAFALAPGHRVVVGLRSEREVEQALEWQAQSPLIPPALWREAVGQGLLSPQISTLLGVHE